MEKTPLISKYRFAPFLFLRTAALSFEDWGKPLSKEQEQALLAAIAYASPDLHEALTKNQKGVSSLKTSARTSLWHYKNRMHFRPTPFGLFSCFSLVPWNNQGNGSIEIEENPHYFVQESMVMEARKKQGLHFDNFRRFHINPSLYRIGKQLRFIHYQMDTKNDRRIYRLRTVEGKTWILAFMEHWKNRTFHPQSALNHLCQSLSISRQEAQDCLNSLFDSGILLPWQRICLTGPAAIERHDSVPALLQAHPPCARPKENPYINAARRYRSGGFHASSLSEIQNDIQSDIQNDIQNDIQSDIQEALAMNHRFMPFEENEDILAFTRAFQQRFEHQVVALQEALDPIRGIAYPSRSAQKRSAPPWSIRRLLLKKWINAQNEKTAIRILESDLASLPDSNQKLPPLPHSLAFIFRVHDQEVFLEQAGGDHGAALLGRFTPFDSKLWKSCKRIIDTEVRAHPDLLFADLVQIEDLHLGNIERRLPLYPYEISLHEGSGIRREQWIPISDLMLSFIQGRLVLWSRKHRKEVVVRLNSAYNAQISPLPAFRFLADFSAAAYRRRLHWQLEDYLPGKDHYPRLYMGKVIQGRETWIIQRSDPKCPIRWPEIERRLNSGTKNEIPPYVSIDRADHQLVFKLDEPSDRDRLIHELRHAERLSLREWLPPRKAWIRDAAGKTYNGQAVGILYDPQPARREVIASRFFKEGSWSKKREESQAAQWMYFKIYLPDEQTPWLFRHYLSPLLKHGHKNQPGKSWFFVRYLDPDPHLRLRIHRRGGWGKGRTEALIATLSECERNGEIARFEIRPYQPEFLRYPPPLINEIESLFCASSRYIARLWDQPGPPSAFALHSPQTIWPGMDAICRGLGLPLQARKVQFEGLFKSIMASHQKEASAFRTTKRHHAEAVRCWNHKDPGSLDPPSWLLPFVEEMENRARNLAAKWSPLSEEKRRSLIADLMHMHLNRQIGPQGLSLEIMVYYLVWKKYEQQYYFASLPDGGLPLL